MPCTRCDACFSKKLDTNVSPSRGAGLDARLGNLSSSPMNRRADHQQHSKPWRLGANNSHDTTAASLGANPGEKALRRGDGVPVVRVARGGSQPMPSSRSPNKYIQHVTDLNREIALQRQAHEEKHGGEMVHFHRNFPPALQNLQLHHAQKNNHQRQLQQRQQQRLQPKFVDPAAATPMPLFHDPISPRRKYDGSNTLTLGPVNLNTKTYLRRSMEKLPVQVPGPDGSMADSQLWTNPELQSASTLLRASEGIGNVRWWRSQVPFSMPYDPAVADYDPSWVNSAVQRVVSDRGVTVHKMNSYAPQHWDSSAAPHLGEMTATGVARSWSLEERAARSVGSVRAPNGVALRCNHFLGESASVHPQASLAGRCLTGQTASTLLTLARPKTISKGSERVSTGLSLAKFAFAHEQSEQATYPGIYPNIGVR